MRGEGTVVLRRPKTLFDGKGDRFGVCSQGFSGTFPHLEVQGVS